MMVRSRYSDLGPRVDAATLRALSLEAQCDPRTLIAELRAARGERARVRGMAGVRARRVLVAHNFIQETAG